MEEEGAPTPTPLDKLERILNSGNTELVKEAFLRMDAAITRKNSQLMSLQAEVKELRDSSSSTVMVQKTNTSGGEKPPPETKEDIQREDRFETNKQKDQKQGGSTDFAVFRGCVFFGGLYVCTATVFFRK